MIKIEIIYKSGIILQKLQQEEELSAKELILQTNMEESDFYMALGWLASERKILIRKSHNDLLIQYMSALVEA